MIKECRTPEEISQTYDVMRQLRPHLTGREEYAALVQTMFSEGYRLAGYFGGQECLGVAGFRAETRLFCGKLIYIDDLVTNETGRSKGIGKALMDWIKKEAASQNINNVFLDSGTHRHSAHKFYFREGFHIGSYNFRFYLDGRMP